MEISWGFFAILILVLLPGLLHRRLYYYGEFSKQFGSGLSLIRLLSVSSIPGMIILTIMFFFYDDYIETIDLGEVLDAFKDINNPEIKAKSTPGITLKDSLIKCLPFIGLVYTLSILSGSLLGRFVRNSGIDTKFKLLRFKNHWFYHFNGLNAKFKKMRFLQESNTKHVFTKADILIESNCNNHLYSGIVVDYELLDNDCTTLSKLILRNAERYKIENGKNVPVNIPGNLLIVDCSAMKNLNLTFVLEKRIDFLESRFPNIIETVFALSVLLLIPFLIFQTDFITWEPYLAYFEFTWYKKLFFYFLCIQVINILNPFNKNEEEEYEYIPVWMLFLKLFWIGVFALLYYLV